MQDDGAEEIQLCLSQLKDIELRNELNKISGALKSAEGPQEKDNLIKEFDRKAKELHIKR